MKTADITARAFLTAVVDVLILRGSYSASRWDVASMLAGHPENVGTPAACQDYPQMPAKLVLSKARNLIRKKLLDGCGCGCRGDFAPICIYRHCPACGHLNVHHLRGRADVTEGDTVAMILHRECWCCHRTWLDRVQL